MEAAVAHAPVLQILIKRQGHDRFLCTNDIAFQLATKLTKKGGTLCPA